MAQLPPNQTADIIQFIEGGVGVGESEAIVNDAKKWSLLLEFSQTNGKSSEWISGVQLVIKDPAGLPLFTHLVDGPMILLNLTPGKYRIEATYAGQMKSIHLDVLRDQHQKINLNWK